MLSDDWDYQDDQRPSQKSSLSFHWLWIYSAWMPLKSKLILKCTHCVWVLFETKEKVCFIKFYTWYYIFVELTSSLLMPQNREKKQIAKLKICSPYKIHHYMYVWLVCELPTQKFYCLTQRHRWWHPVSLVVEAPVRSHGNHLSSQLSGSSQNFFKRLGWSGWSYGNKALYTYLPIINT